MQDYRYKYVYQTGLKKIPGITHTWEFLDYFLYNDSMYHCSPIQELLKIAKGSGETVINGDKEWAWFQ